MQFKFFLLPVALALLIFSCGSPQKQVSEAPAEESMEVMEEAAPEEAVAEETEGPGLYDLRELPCKNDQGELLVDNLYQMTKQQQIWIDNDSRYYGNILYYARMEFASRFNSCFDGDWMDIRTAAWNLFPIDGGEFRQDLRYDLMPEIEAEMMVVPEPVVRFITEKMIASPEAIQVDGYSYQQIYDYFKWEIRKVYFAYQLLDKYSSFEKELRAYARAATTLKEENDDLITVNNYQKFTEQINIYADPEWANSSGLDVPLDGYYDQYCAFWCRRGLDNSADELLELVTRILANYDEQWMNNLNQEMQKLPSISFDENRIANVIPSSEFQQVSDSTRLDFVSKAENGFMVSFENSESRIYQAGEYNSFSVAGYQPELNILQINEDSEYSDVLLVNLATGNSVALGGMLNLIKPSPDGKLFIASIMGHVHTYSLIFKWDGDKYQKLLSTRLLSARDMNWISPTEIQVTTSLGGNVFIDLSDHHQPATARRNSSR
jgi:hypothetical protein